MLFSKSPAILMDTVTNSEGKFTFDHFPRVDTAMFVLKALNKSGKSFNVGIAPEETPAPQFKLPALPQSTPWYVNSDSSFMHLANNHIAYQNLQGYVPDGKHHLREVVIKAQKTIKGSQNLNGPGNADIVLDEKFLEASGQKSFLQLLETNIKGFHDEIATIADPNVRVFHRYLINHKIVLFVIDGVLLQQIYPRPEDVREYLLGHDAGDIKGIEVMSSEKFALYYKSRYFPEAPLDSLAFVEITTRSGHGPIIDNTPGMYLYKPLAITWPAQFYKPKYTVKDTLHMPDYRSTIDWEPNIITDAAGKATVSFYAADKPSTYTIIMEGTDANGNIGYKRQKLVIRHKKMEAKSK